ncbi:MAG: hypothetical protein HF314_04580 [Ignavibacteria bacterium]|jgi:hypothetical protein|nr:hypothetical protein [Ignavibacteria bacterium]MCU7502326.1 hypothetical protein [Ignavibacteria bacterium]MCU7518497.1 hypothetical protein [Ignavibacteria bacterium]
MGLLPIIGKAVGLFSFLSITAIAISYIMYKMRGPKNKPYNDRKPFNNYPVQQNYMPALQTSSFETPAFQSPAYQNVHYNAEAYNERAELPERRILPERQYVQERMNVPERRQEMKSSPRQQSKFQLLHSTEDGEIKAYQLPTGGYKYFA